MVYDVSKKINVGLAKIYAKLVDNLYLRKTDAEKEYLSLDGGKLTGDVTFDKSSITFKNNSDTSKINLQENGSLKLNSDGDVRFSRGSNEYFVVNPSFLSLNNQHNPISIEIINEEGADSPYSGITIYDNSKGTPELVSAINSGYMAGIPYQEFMTREDGSFIWTFVEGEDLHETAKIDKNGFTLLNKDDETNEISAIKFQSSKGDIAGISSVLGDMRLEASEIIFNNVATIGNDSIDLIGGSCLEFDSANDGVKLYSKSNSNALTIDVNGKQFTFDENGFNGNVSSATEASKLSAERTVSGGTDIVMNYKYDGSKDSDANIGFYSCNAKVGNQNNFPYHRFARISLTTENYEDWTTTLYISQGYNGGGFGICRISLRTNGIGYNSSAEVKWLARNGLPVDFVSVAIDATVSATYADAYVKCGAAYASTTIRAIASESRGDIERTWELIDSEEVNDTTEYLKRYSLECYKTISDAGTEIHSEPYTNVVTGVDTVVEYAKRDEEGRNISHTYITNIEREGYGIMRVTYGDGYATTINLLEQ